MPRQDIDFSFKRNPLTGDILTKNGSAAIKQAIKNIILTEFYDRGFNVNFGSNVTAAMFENITILTSQTIRDNISNALNNYEPNCDLLDVTVVDNDDNSITVSIYYNEFNNPDTQTLVIEMERLR